ncbi:MAG TPA: methyl-accepting chemotaxis protein [Methanospirillum sp.]|nr:methyl-accepting chemotaxis protein [Methanospirillum sp.]
MVFFENIRIGYKLLGGYIVISAIMILVAFFGVSNMNMIAGNSDTIYSDALIPVHTLDTVDAELGAVRTDVLRYILFPNERQALKENMSSRFAFFDKTLSEYQQKYGKSSSSSEIERLKELFVQLKDAYQPVMDASDRGKMAEATEYLSANSERVAIRDEILNLLNKEISKNLQNADALRKDNNSAASSSALIFIIVTISAAVASLGFGLYLSNSITKPLSEVVSVAEQIGQGRSSARVSFARDDEIGSLGRTLNKMGEHISAMVNDTKNLASSAQKGELSVRSDPSLHEGDYRLIITEFNSTLDAVVGPLNVAAEYVDRISKGDIPPTITDSYYGDFNEIKKNLNQCIDAVNLLVSDANRLSDAAIMGKLDTRADATKHQGDFRKIVDGVNNTLDSVIGPLNVAAEYVDRISKGDIPPVITDSYNGDFNEIKNNLNQCIEAVNLLVSDANRLSDAAIRGNLDTRADATKHQGDFRKIVDGVNNTLDSVIGPLNVAAEYVDRISKGDIPPTITDSYSGDFNEIKNNLNQCVEAVNLLISDATTLSNAAINGKLSTRAESSRHNGDFKKIVDGVNATLDAVIEPVHEAMRVSQEFAVGNFSARVNESLSVKGDFVDFKESLNRIGIELSRMMTMINEELFESVNVLSAASSEILSVTAELSSGTAQTASSVNETSVTVEEVRKTTDMSNNKAKNVSEKSMAAIQVALTGQESVEEILTGMTHIQQQMESIAGNVVKLSEQSQAIGEIIATVTDIAEQSNLLAVNASIEAAKAGDYGRGFGVVAQEIKNLAEQSKQATSHIRTILTDIQRGISSAVISTEQGTKTVATGLRLSNEAKDAIATLSQSVNDAAKSAVQITASSQEQVVGMDQISSAMESIRLAAQNNLEVTHQVEKTAKDLHDLGITLKQITERFKL